MLAPQALGRMVEERREVWSAERGRSHVALSNPKGTMSSRTQHHPASRFTTWIAGDVVAGVLMISAAVAALAWANSPWRESYSTLSAITIGPAALNLNLSLSTWAADGLLAIFFLVVGLELKHEIVAGSLRNPRQAGVPVLAAIGGMLLPALIYVGVVLALGSSASLQGWAIPTATDIAFALAILAIFGRGLPAALRVFLLTLAVVDDLLAIIVIAVFYSQGVDLLALLAAMIAVGVFAVAARMKRLHWWILVPLGVIAWIFMHESGVHATIAGVMLGLAMPAKAIHGDAAPRTHQVERFVRPLTAGLALPIFAFFAAGITVDGGDSITSILTDPVAIAIVAALIAGKLTGVLGVTAIVTRITPLRLPDRIGVRDLLPIALLAAIGFTVSLLIAELSFAESTQEPTAKLAVLIASAMAALLAAVALRWDARRARRRDMNNDGVPDHDPALIP